jgi:hypothetical protein
MFNFVDKVVESLKHEHTPGKRVSVKVIWKNGVFVGKYGDKLVSIADYDDLTNCKWLYALPTNTYYTPWHRSPYDAPVKPDKNALEMRLRFWGKYKTGMTIYGKIVDNVFHEVKHRDNESGIPKVIAEQISDAAIHPVV